MVCDVTTPLHSLHYMNWIDSHSRVDEGVTVGSCMINLLLLASSEQDLQHALDQFSAACDQAVMKTSTKHRAIMFLQKPKVVYAASERQYTAAGGEVQVPWGGARAGGRIPVPSGRGGPGKKGVPRSV